MNLLRREMRAESYDRMTNGEFNGQTRALPSHLWLSMDLNRVIRRAQDQDTTVSLLLTPTHVALCTQYRFSRISQQRIIGTISTTPYAAYEQAHDGGQWIRSKVWIPFWILDVGRV